MTLLGSGSQPYPVAVPPIQLPVPPAVDDTPTEVLAKPDVPAEPFDVSKFHEAFAQLKQQVTDRRTTLTQDVAALKAEDEQLTAQIADWDARANAGEDRRKAIAAELDGKLADFDNLDQATTHLEATEALLYPAATPAPADATTPAPTAADATPAPATADPANAGS
jgi:multidrug resistance efflux pump